MKTEWRATIVGLAVCAVFFSFAFVLSMNASKKTKAAPRTPLDINQVGAAELATLPGIGIVTARQIVLYREKNGPFRRVEDLLILRGMSVKKLEKIRPFIKVEKPKR